MKLNLLETGVKVWKLQVAIASFRKQQVGVFYDITRQRGMGHANTTFPIPFP